MDRRLGYRHPDLLNNIERDVVGTNEVTEQYLLTVVVPLYNSSSYIVRCAESLFKQTVSSLEILFIDDASKDNSIEQIILLLDSYPQRKESTRIIKNSKNIGQAGVRDKGFKLASGKYVICCDSDDWVDIDYYQDMLEVAHADNSDVVVAGMTEHLASGKTRITIPEIEKDGKHILMNWYKNPIHMSLCNKMIRKEIISSNCLYFYEGINMWEDNGFMHRVFYYSDRVSRIPNPGYHYDKSNSLSFTKNSNSYVTNQMISCASLLDNFYLNVSNPEDYYYTKETLKFLARINLISGSLKDYFNYKRVFPETNSIISIIPRSAFSKKGYIRYLFVRYHLGWLFVLLMMIAKMTNTYK